MAVDTKLQPFDMTPEQEAEISWLREVLGLSTIKDALLRAVRITAILSREARGGRMLFVQSPGGNAERLVIPELDLRLLVDEDSQARTLVRLLVEAGHDVLTAEVAGLNSLDDAEVLARAIHEQRTLLTRN